MQDLLATLQGSSRICDNLQHLSINMYHQRECRIACPFLGADVPSLHELFFAPRRPSSRCLDMLTLKPHATQNHSCDILNFSSSFKRISSLNVDGRVKIVDPLHPLALGGDAVHIDRLEVPCIPETGGVWLDLLRTHQMSTFITALSFTHPNVSHMAERERQAVEKAVHSFIRSCENLRSLDIFAYPYAGLTTYPSTCPTLRHISYRGAQYCVEAEPLTVEPCWQIMSDLVQCPIASAVPELTTRITIFAPYGAVLTIEDFETEVRTKLYDLD